MSLLEKTIKWEEKHPAIKWSLAFLTMGAIILALELEMVIMTGGSLW